METKIMMMYEKCLIFAEPKEKWCMTVYAIVAFKTFAGHRALLKFAKKVAQSGFSIIFHENIKKIRMTLLWVTSILVQC